MKIIFTPINTSKLMLCVICMLSSISYAQTKYRCGNSFQDRPCADGKGSAIGHSSSNQTSKASSDTKEKIVIDAQCVKKGEAAMKIIWQRDGGALQEDVLAKATNGEQRELILNVYANRGNAIGVRQKIETQCMKDKESPIEQMTRLNRANQLNQASNAKKTAENMMAEERVSDGQKKNLLGADSQIALQAAKMKQQCGAIKAQLMVLKSELREGGDGQRMEYLNSQKRALDKELSTLSCL